MADGERGIGEERVEAGEPGFRPEEIHLCAADGAQARTPGSIKNQQNRKNREPPPQICGVLDKFIDYVTDLGRSSFLF
ncbi:unnamed protein product [Heligmosomoides polygyrus]|uniref:Uncharacterized protein n=1 Tax=Heligmosomoides polygyrus TaxID=6339 RepID=A0A183F6M5_HELPZ|nr:unnamed protein product [Heligmosomoides polygyrus]